MGSGKYPQILLIPDVKIPTGYDVGYQIPIYRYKNVFGKKC